MIAVCLVSYNLPDYTRWCVESVIKNSKDLPVRFFFLDNGSRGPEVHDYFRSVSVGEPVVLRNEVNQWVYAGWNQVLSEAMKHDPEMICLISSDVMVGRDWAPPILRELQTDPMAYFLPNGDFRSHENFNSDVEAMLLRVSLDQSKLIDGRAGWCFFFGPEAVRTFLPIPESLKLWYGDDYIHWKLTNAGYRRRVVLDSCAIHFVSKSLALLDPVMKTRMIENDRAEYERLTGERM